MTPDEQHDLDEIATTLVNITPTDQPTVLIGWVTVAEYSDLDGKRWLAVRSGSAPDTNHLTTSWQRRGYLDEVLHSEWLDYPNYDATDEPDNDD